MAASMRALVAAGQATEAAERFVDYWSGTAAWSRRLGLEPQRSIVSRMPVVVQPFDTLFAELLPEARLRGLTMPVLCLAGERSTAAARRLSGLLRGLLPGAQHETLAALTHMGPIANAPLVNDRLVQRAVRRHTHLSRLDAALRSGQ